MLLNIFAFHAEASDKKIVVSGTRDVNRSQRRGLKNKEENRLLPSEWTLSLLADNDEGNDGGGGGGGGGGGCMCMCVEW